MHITMKQLQDYLYCSLLYYLKYEAHSAAFQRTDMSTVELPGKAISQALQIYKSEKHADMTFRELTRAVWGSWLKQKNIGTDAVTMLLSYEDLRNQIMRKFFSGEIKKRGGKMYIEPRLTRRFKTMMDNAGLWAIAERIEESMLLQMDVTPAELGKLGKYRIADAYADSMLMAERYKLPSPRSIVGVNIVLPVKTSASIQLQTKIDMIVEGKAGPVAIIHDSAPTFFLNKAWVGRNIAVIAASLAKTSANTSSLNIQPVMQVVYKHLMKGEDVRRKELRASRLSLALLHAIRGIEANIYLPQFLTGDLGRCKKCPAAFLCLNVHEDPIEASYPGTMDWAARVVLAAEKINNLSFDKEDLSKIIKALGEEKITPQDMLRFQSMRRSV